MLSTKLKEAAGNSADATLYVDDVFSTYLYTGNGSTQTITNGIDLAGKGGLVWIKSRSQGSTNYIGNNLLYGSAIGYERMYSNNDSAAGSGNVISVSSTGFTTEALAASSYNGDNFASWTFRKAAKFFDVVTYTGTGSARTIAHSLGVAPGMVIVKRTDTTGDWQVYSNGLTSAAYSIQLNLIDAQASAPTVWNSTAPTSSVFSVGADATVNASGGTYVAYLYAHDTDADGFIQCGSYTTNGSGTATVTLGWEPQWLLYKDTGASGEDWAILDNMRGWTVGGTDALLRPNLSAAEVNANRGNPTATGFEISGMSASSTYIYMAIRMPNKPPTTGTQVYNAITRAGTSANATVSGVGFASDALISAIRSGSTSDRAFFDKLRGTGVWSATNSTASEYSASNTITQWGNETVNLGPDTTYAVINYNGPYNYINWLFKRAPGFFDEVCWTRTTTVATLNHNLTVVPQLIIKKDRSKAGTYWDVMINVSPYDYRYDIYLNDTQAISGPSGGIYWNAAPTATTFDVNMAGDGSSNGDTFVAYLFATLAGISKVGSYTGNGTGQVIACGFSTGARFVLIKRTDAVGNWYTFDSARGLTVGSSPYLLLNSTAAETTGDNGVYASTGGFTLSAAALLTTNIVGASYIFLAVS